VLSTQRRIIAREYRNRRIGDFLKELNLTEVRGTGFPAIYGALEANGSPEPSFETADANYVLVTLPAHVNDPVSDGARDQAKLVEFKVFAAEVAYGGAARGGARDGDRDQVKAIPETELHEKVEGLITGATNWVSREDLFKSIGL